ncbi:hypothetical protein [Tabrizicola sp. BL-A-41-H6]|uniref:hypothetical protein n=1 Tax=Tabrizicola sp. BL-A-41-H6 TaxID=3421107 RepID=UPI003D66A968
MRMDAPRRMVHLEHFSRDPAYCVEVTTDLAVHGSGTRMTHLMRYASADARAAAVADGSTDWMEAVFGRIDTLSFDQKGNAP